MKKNVIFNYFAFLNIEPEAVPKHSALVQMGQKDEEYISIHVNIYI